MVATEVPVTPAQPRDVHIYIGWIHTASIFIYIMDQGAKGAVPAVPAIPFCPCQKGWILLWDACSAREDGSRCEAAVGGWILLWDKHSSCVRPPAPLLCQALAVPGCSVPWAGMAVLYVPSIINPLGCPGAACLLLSGWRSGVKGAAGCEGMGALHFIVHISHRHPSPPAGCAHP